VSGYLSTGPKKEKTPGGFYIHLGLLILFMLFYAAVKRSSREIITPAWRICQAVVLAFRWGGMIIENFNEWHNAV
jgi:hypothetical protein